MVRAGPVLLLLLLLGCAAGGESGPPGEATPERRDLRVENLAAGAPGRGPQRPRVVVASSAGALPGEPGAGVRGAGEGTYLVVYRGEQPTGGYSVNVRAASVRGDRVTVRLALKGPPEGAIVAQVLTYPYVVSVLEGLDPAGKEFSFVDGRGEPLGWPTRRVGG